MAPATASTCTSAPTTSAEFCGAADDWYVGETLGFGNPGDPLIRDRQDRVDLGEHRRPDPAARPGPRVRIGRHLGERTLRDARQGRHRPRRRSVPDGRLRRQLDGDQGSRRRTTRPRRSAAPRAPATTSSSTTAPAPSRSPAGIRSATSTRPPGSRRSKWALTRCPTHRTVALLRARRPQRRARGSGDRHGRPGALLAVRVHPRTAVASARHVQGDPPGLGAHTGRRHHRRGLRLRVRRRPGRPLPRRDRGAGRQPGDAAGQRTGSAAR